MDLQLNQKNALVAASSRGLGYGIAEALVQEGANVAIGSRSSEKIQAAVQTLSGKGNGRVVGHSLDASNSQSIADWIDASVSDLGEPDILVINAGGPPAGKFDDFDDRAWQDAFDLTLMSAVRMIRDTVPLMQKRGGGSILAVTSISIKEPIDNLLLSNVMRSGVASLLKSLSPDLAKDNIRINNLVPGRFDTDRVRELDQTISQKMGVSVEQQQQNVRSNIPMNRYGTPEEFGQAAAFLLSPIAGYVTGETFLVDGGISRTVW